MTAHQPAMDSLHFTKQIIRNVPINTYRQNENSLPKLEQIHLQEDE